ncbi:hypothetical protein BH10ACT11_BH10ACT11_05680 [soil metagenome]
MSAAAIESDPPLPAAVIERTRALLTDYTPPDFGHVPDADSALFLCAVDHKAGYASEHLVDGMGPFRGSALMWEAGLAAARRDPGLLSADRLESVTAAEVAERFSVEGDTVADPERRAGLWRDLARGLWREHSGSATALIEAGGDALGGGRGSAGASLAIRGVLRSVGQEEFPLREDR